MIVLDRIEGNRAVLEMDGEIIEVPASILPPAINEGAVLVFVEVEAPGRLAEAEARLERLRAAGPQEDDIDLTK